MSITPDTPENVYRFPYETLSASSHSAAAFACKQKPVVQIDEVYAYIDMVRQQYINNGIGRFVAITKDTNELIGWTGIKFVNDHVENGNTNFYDYGYRLNEKFWNKGFATEASNAWLDYGFNQMKIQEMNAYAHAENGASNHVLQKVGFNFMEDYPDENGVTWKWWQLKNLEFRNQNLER